MGHIQFFIIISRSNVLIEKFQGLSDGRKGGVGRKNFWVCPIGREEKFWSLCYR
jgi:hypothetical protein